MANPRQRRKQKSGTKSATRRTRHHSSHTINVSDPLIRAAWDKGKTVRQNFEAMGLAEDVNRTIASSGMRKKMMAWQETRSALKEEIAQHRLEAKKRAEEANVLDMTPVDFGEDAIFGQLNSIFGEYSSEGAEAGELKLIDLLEQNQQQPSLKKERPLGAEERELMKKLTGKHGSDFLAMARDLKLNVLQHTPKQLESLYKRQ
jgi:nucleolar protein 16